MIYALLAAPPHSARQHPDFKIQETHIACFLKKKEKVEKKSPDISESLRECVCFLLSVS